MDDLKTRRFGKVNEGNWAYSSSIDPTVLYYDFFTIYNCGFDI